MKTKTLIYEQKHSKKRFKNLRVLLLGKLKKIKPSILFKGLGGILITIKCIEVAYLQRGYFAIGGEYLLIPLVLLVRKLVKDFIETRRKENV